MQHLKEVKMSNCEGCMFALIDRNGNVLCESSDKCEHNEYGSEINW